MRKERRRFVLKRADCRMFEAQGDAPLAQVVTRPGEAVQWNLIRKGGGAVRHVTQAVYTAHAQRTERVKRAKSAWCRWV